MKSAVVMLAIFSVVSLYAPLVRGQEVVGVSVTEYIAKGDALYDAYDNEGALEEYKKAYKADTSNCEALWKLTRAHIDVGEQAEQSLQRQYYSLAERYARKAVRHGSDIAEAHFQLAVALGRVALDAGGKTKVRLSVEVKSEAERAVELNPAHDGALHVLGRWHREVANLSGVLKAFAKILYGGLPPASNEEAVDYFKRAIAIDTDHINHHLELARTYVEMKEWQLAKDEYDKVIELPLSDADDAAHKEEAAKELAEVNNKLK